MKTLLYDIPPPLSRLQIRELEERAIREFGVPGLLLMENAAEGCIHLLERWLARPEGFPGPPLRPPFRAICGSGNNGGDGLALARHLFNRDAPVEVYLASPAGRFRPGSDAAANLEMARRLGMPIFEGDGRLEQALSGGTLIDAIFGSGLSRPVEGPERAWIEAMNRSGLPVLAVDIPSGLDADTGARLGAAVRAHVTATFVAPKTGFYLLEGPQCTGLVQCIGISIPRQILPRAAPGSRPWRMAPGHGTINPGDITC